jgi:hypothetical protein
MLFSSFDISECVGLHAHLKMNFLINWTLLRAIFTVNTKKRDFSLAILLQSKSALLINVLCMAVKVRNSDTELCLTWQALQISHKLFRYQNLSQNMKTTVEANGISYTPYSKSVTVRWRCHGPGGKSLASHRGGPGSIPGQSMWTKWHWHRFFFQYFGFPCQYQSTNIPYAIKC